MRCPFAQWQGSPNDYPGGMDREPMGVVLHIEQGYESGTISVFHSPGAQASAHFGIDKDGHIDQFVDTNDAAWAEVAGNRHWISIEHAGFTGEALTEAQLAADVRLIAWLKGAEGGPDLNFPLEETDDVNLPGLGWHGMGGADWGGHTQCPGDPIKAQRPEILQGVEERLGGHNPSPAPKPGPAPHPAPVPPQHAPPFPGRFLRTPPNIQGGDVRSWQAQMRRRGWNIGVDGIYGPQSAGICRQFQQEKHLGIDGVVGPITWNAAWTSPVT